MQIKLSFLGAAQNVTGSCYLLEANDTRILVDCGLYQEEKLKDRNWEAFPIPPDTIDAILLTHAHIDHCGLIPKLVHEGFRGNIYCTEATSEIARIVLLDSAHLQEEDAALKKKRNGQGRKVNSNNMAPLYTVDDVNASWPLFSSVKYREPVHIGKEVKATFHNAGHVLGSAMIEIVVGQGKDKRTIVFSGDVGRFDAAILRDPKIFTKTDYVIIESTYGNKTHTDPMDICDCLAEIVNSTHEAGGNIVIPSFALQRSQELLYHLNNLLIKDRIPHLMVFLDSPMAISITEVFKRHSELFDKEMMSLLKHNNSPFEFPGLKMIHTADESKALNHIKGTIMIIAGSGMCTGGRIKHHLVTNISRPESTILFVGYQAVGTLGRQIVDGAKKIRIMGDQYTVRARVAQVHGLSAHADKDELLRWLSGLIACPTRLFVTHGEPQAASEFAEFLRQKTKCEVSVPEYKEEFILE